MKLIIDIPKELKSEVYRCGVFLSPIEKESLINAINNGTPIPDNATNGDVIKAMFPNAEYKHVKTMSGIDGMEVSGINGLYDNFEHWCAEDIFFHDDWWNSPYQKGGKNEN